MPKLTWLADEFRAAGITVVEEDGWKTRGRSWRGVGGLPDGGVQHHTAPPVPFPVTKLYKPTRIKCNWNVKPDGTLHLIAAGACNYSTGKGSSVVHDDVKAGRAPTGTALKRRLLDDMGGNSYFLNNETDHSGDGSPIPDAQYQTVLAAWVAVCRKLAWPADKIIAHGEWSRRKPDPAWNGKDSHENAQQIRADITAALHAGDSGGLIAAVGSARPRLTDAAIAAAFNGGIIRRRNGNRYKPESVGAVKGIAYWSDPARTDEEWNTVFWPAFDNGVAVRTAELSGN